MKRITRLIAIVLASLFIGSIFFGIWASTAYAKKTPAPAVSPTPTPWQSLSTPTPEPTEAVSTPQPAYTGQSPLAEAAQAAAATAAPTPSSTAKASGDVWGSISIPGGAGYSIYSNRGDGKGGYYYNKDYNHIFSMTPQNAQVAVIMGHNMRKSGSMFHALHHVQNAWLGKSKCEKGCSIDPAAKTSTFYITYANHTQWQLVAFFEGSAAMRNTFAQNYGATGAQKASLISQFLGYSTGTYKGAVVGSAAETDDIMVFITCGDKGSKGGTFLCMLLKGA